MKRFRNGCKLAEQPIIDPKFSEKAYHARYILYEEELGKKFNNGDLRDTMK